MSGGKFRRGAMSMHWIMAGQAPASSQDCYDPLRPAALQRVPRPAAPPAVHVDIIKAAFPASDA